jgi:hypothetical protein
VGGVSVVSRIDLECTLGANALHLLVKLRGRSCGTTQLRDEMLVVGVPSAEEHLNVTDWQFLRLRLLVTGRRKTGAQLRVELQNNAPNQDEGSKYARDAAMFW